jgi:hypothetical protein
MLNHIVFTILSIAFLPSLPAIAQKPAASSCKSPYSDAPLPLLINPLLSWPGSQRIQKAVQQAEFAAEFLRANRSDRAAQFNEALRREFRLEPAEMTVLSILQNLEAGKTQAAIALLPQLQDLVRFRRPLTEQLMKRPLAEQTTWVQSIISQPAQSAREQAIHLDWLLLVAEQHLEKGQPAAALPLLDAARARLDKAPLSDTLRLVTAYRKTNKPDIARSLLTPALIEAARSQASTRGGATNIKTLIHLGRELALLGQKPQAMTLLGQAEAILKPQSRDFLNDTLAQTYAAVGEAAKAIALLRPFGDGGYATLANQAAQRGDDRLAEQALRLIRDRRSQSATRQNIVQQLAEAGKFEAARRSASALSEGHAKLNTLAMIVKFADLANQTAIANAIIAEMQQLQAAPVQIFDLLSGVEAFISVGANDRARAALVQLTQQQDSAWLNLNFAEKYAAIGDYVQANRLIDSHLVEPPKPVPVPLLRLPSLPSVPLVPSFGSPFVSFFDSFVNFPTIRSTPIPFPNPLPNRRTPARTKQLPLTQTGDDQAISQAKYARAYATARNFAKATQFANQIPDRYCNFKSGVWQHIATAALGADQLEVALDALQRSDRLDRRAQSTNPEFVRSQLIAIAKRHAQRNQFQQSALLLELALKIEK